jgi:hypothetical protein
VKRKKYVASLALALAFAATSALAGNMRGNASHRIQPYAANPAYWQYRGHPVVLFGGSSEDNLFQIPDLERHLNQLAAVGGNYVRNTMSARDDGNVQPFVRLADGRYDLDRWNDVYWRRFEQLLGLARALNIIVQIEVWDRFDFSREQWEAQPFNPKNNVNYGYEQSGFHMAYPQHPGENDHPFFFTTPAQHNNKLVLRYQQRFVDELLSRSLRFPNVLYCISNETSGDEAWSTYWAEYIQARARRMATPVFITEMWDDWNLQAPSHRRTFDTPARYGFVDISQNNHLRGDLHWRMLQWVRSYLAKTEARPINNVKIYGAGRPAHAATVSGLKRLLGRAPTMDSTNDYGSSHEAAARWWRNLIGGAAAVRFHRPASGIGLNEQAQQHMRSTSLLLKAFDIIRAIPDTDHSTLFDRDADEAYATRIADGSSAVYFPNGGNIRLVIPREGDFTVRWLSIDKASWVSSETRRVSRLVSLTTPADGHWIALVEPSTAKLFEAALRQ